MPKKRRLDPKRPFGRILSMNPDPNKATFEQDGILFNQDHEEVGVAPGYDRLRAKAAPAVAAPDEGADIVAERARSILGDLGPVDPHAEARRENAAAAGAEVLADDA